MSDRDGYINSWSWELVDDPRGSCDVPSDSPDEAGEEADVQEASYGPETPWDTFLPPLTAEERDRADADSERDFGSMLDAADLARKERREGDA